MGGGTLADDPIRVVLVDDHDGTREGLTALLNAEPDMKVVAAVATVAAAIDDVAGLAPDVAVIDVQLPDGNGIALCSRLQVISPSTRCIIHTGVEIGTETATAAGAVAVVVKQIRGSQLLDAIRNAGDTRC